MATRSEEEWSRFEQRVVRDLKMADEVAQGITEGLDLRPESDFAWEWPTGAIRGWRGQAVQRLLKKVRDLNCPIDWCRFHGCAYGLKFHEIPIRKGWTVLTTNRRLWLSLQRKCPGRVEHAECRGVAAQASAYYPPAMVRAVAQVISNGWLDREAQQGVSMVSDIEHYLLDVPAELYGQETDETNMVDNKARRELSEAAPEVFALSRTSYPTEPPTGRKT